MRSTCRLGLDLFLESRELLSGFTPAQIAHSYGFDQVQAATRYGRGTTVAIVDAQDDPNIRADLATFDRTYHLPDAPLHVFYPGAVPAPDPQGWGVEIALDVEWVHALAPGASIDLVLSADASLGSLANAVTYAANLPGVSVVSLSWGGPDFAGSAFYDFTAFSQPPPPHGPVAFSVSSGDQGGIVSYPSASPLVLSVGGTSLQLNGRSYLSESAWSDGGGGPSAFETLPSGKPRATPDVSFDADPATGVSVFDSAFTRADGSTPGWLRVGGTSFSAPAWAALLALADAGRAAHGHPALTVADIDAYLASKHDPRTLHDITTGSNGYPAGPGYDLATGHGSPVVNRLIPALETAPVVPTVKPRRTQAVPPPVIERPLWRMEDIGHVMAM